MQKEYWNECIIRLLIKGEFFCASVVADDCRMSKKHFKELQIIAYQRRDEEKNV